MTIKEIEETIIDEFANFDEWLDKYAYIIDLGKQCPPIDPKDKTDNNLIKGCQSRVWLSCEHRDGRLWFRALDGQTPQDILAADLAFIDQIGLKEHLSPTRSNGLTSMVKQMKLYALAFSQIQ